MKKKVISIVAVVLVLCCAIGGTLAWLTDKTGEVKNTFTPADIGVTLTETLNTDTNGDGTKDAWKADMIPGFSYAKNPVVTVTKGSVDCYLFVKFDVSASTGLVYTSLLNTENGWTQGTGEGGNGVPTDVWYRVVPANNADQAWHLLKDDVVSINENLTKDNMPKTASTLTYTAYASQLYKSAGVEFTAAEAWSNVPKN